MQNVKTRATFVATIFDVLAWVVLGLGALAALFVLLAAIGEDEFGAGLIMALGITVYTVVSWAGISLASIIAGYIEKRS